LPVGSLIALDGKVVAEDPGRVYQSRSDLTLQTKMEALQARLFVIENERAG